jgi:alkylation response protein AidB-like acyl-CoA dehydrogenase
MRRVAAFMNRSSPAAGMAAPLPAAAQGRVLAVTLASGAQKKHGLERIAGGRERPGA